MGWSFQAVFARNADLSVVAELGASWLSQERGGDIHVDTKPRRWDDPFTANAVVVAQARPWTIVGLGILGGSLEGFAYALAPLFDQVLFAAQESTSGSNSVLMLQHGRLVREVCWMPYGIVAEAGVPLSFEAEWRSPTTETDRSDWLEEQRYIAEVHGDSPPKPSDAPKMQCAIEDAASYFDHLGIDLWKWRTAKSVFALVTDADESL